MLRGANVALRSTEHGTSKRRTARRVTSCGSVPSVEGLAAALSAASFNKPLQQTAARRRALMPSTSRPWWTTTGSLVATCYVFVFLRRPLLNGGALCRRDRAPQERLRGERLRGVGQQTHRMSPSGRFGVLCLWRPKDIVRTLEPRRSLSRVNSPRGLPRMCAAGLLLMIGCSSQAEPAASEGPKATDECSPPEPTDPSTCYLPPPAIIDADPGDPRGAVEIDPEAGFIEVDGASCGSPRARLFYSFRPADGAPGTKPLLVRFNGGPGYPTSPICLDPLLEASSMVLGTDLDEGAQRPGRAWPRDPSRVCGCSSSPLRVATCEAGHELTVTHGAEFTEDVEAWLRQPTVAAPR